MDAWCDMARAPSKLRTPSFKDVLRLCALGLDDLEEGLGGSEREEPSTDVEDEDVSRLRTEHVAARASSFRRASSGVARGHGVSLRNAGAGTRCGPFHANAERDNHDAALSVSLRSRDECRILLCPAPGDCRTYVLIRVMERDV